MRDKFLKEVVVSAYMFTAAYLPKHKIVLWKEKCWGDIRLFLRRLGIGRTRRWVSRLNRNLFCPSVKHEKSGNVRQPFIQFPINASLIWSQILNITVKIIWPTSAMFFDRSEFCFGTCTTRHWGEHSNQDLKKSDQWSWRSCDNKLVNGKFH